MFEKPDPAHRKPHEDEMTTPAEQDKVGPGHPPAHTRWKKGGPSPNPRGRPRKGQSMLPEFRKTFLQAINKKVPASRGDRKVLLNRFEIGVEQLLSQFAKGDRHARRDMLEWAAQLGINLSAEHGNGETLSPSHQAILAGYLARHSGAENVPPAERVLAPAELLNDDLPGREATVPATPPQAETKPDPIPDPLPKPGTAYPKPFSRMRPGERRAWYPEWYAKYKSLLDY